MPNRYVRASAIESEAVNTLTWQGEVFWRRLINRVDDFGRFTANTALLRANLFPLQLDKVSVSDIGRLLAECESAGLIGRYESGGKPYLVMSKWEKGRAKRSEHPPPPAALCEAMQTYVYECEHMSAHAPGPVSVSVSDTDSDTLTHSLGASKAIGGRRAENPGIDEVLAFAHANAIAEHVAQTFYDDCEARPLHASGAWTLKDGNPVHKWKNALQSFNRRWLENERRATARTAPNGNNRGYSPAQRQKPGDDEKF